VGSLLCIRARGHGGRGCGDVHVVLTIVSTAIGATLARPVDGVPYGSLAVPLAGGIVLAIATWLMGDRVIPSSVRHMDGFGRHIYCGGTAQASGTE
jgi:hypothetical protein